MARLRAQVVTFVDSDDEVLFGVYERALMAMETTGADVVLFGVRTIWVSEGLTKEDSVPEADYGTPTPRDVAALSRACLFNYAWNKLYRRSFLEAHGIVFERAGMPSEDTVFNLDCLLAGARLAAIATVGYVYYRTGGTSLSRYKPTLAEGIRLEWGRWARFDGRPAGEDGILAAEWANLWMPGSPLSWNERVAWACERKAALCRVLPCWQRLLLKISPKALGIGRGIFYFARRYLYLRPIRRWHIRRLYPQVQEWHA